MSTNENNSQQKFSLARVLAALVPVIAVAVGVAAYSRQWEKKANAELERSTLVRLIGEQTQLTLAKDYQDADGDLVADAPADISKSIDPPTLKFAYIPQSDIAKDNSAWKEFLESISKKLNKPVEQVAFANTEEQLAALKSGELHITAFATGEAETAVNEAGFVPVACAANDAGEFGYKMMLIVPSTSKLKAPADLRDVHLTLTRSKSNSGCVAPIVVLAKQFNLLLDRDYEFGFSQSHENSIRGIVSGQYEAAAVASDTLARLAATDKTVTADSYRVIFESQSFPSGVIGAAYNLKPEIMTAIRDTFQSFDWKGTGLQTAYSGDGSTKFVMVDYKADWEPVRKLRADAQAMAFTTTN
jgi:phosphonate transport system substrate-binding protein